MNDIQEIKKEIREAVDEINKLPNKTYGNVRLGEIKRKALSALNDAEIELQSVENVHNNLEDIRKQIIKPVNKIIQNNSKKSDGLAWIGIFSGALGLLLTFLQVYYIYYPINEDNSKEAISLKLDNYLEKVDSLTDLRYKPIWIIDSKRNDNTTKFSEYLYEDIKGMGYKNITKQKKEVWYNDEKCPINRKKPIIYFRNGNIIDVNLYKATKKYFGKIVEIKHYRDADNFIKRIFNEEDKLELIIVV